MKMPIYPHPTILIPKIETETSHKNDGKLFCKIICLHHFVKAKTELCRHKMLDVKGIWVYKQPQ